MSDFGADTSDFDSDFRAGLSDYASDFCDFPGDSGSDFGREVRNSGSRTDGMEGPPGSRRDRTAGDRHPQQIESRRIVTMEAASWQRKRKATEQGTTPRHKAINKAHSARRSAGI